MMRLGQILEITEHRAQDAQQLITGALTEPQSALRLTGLACDSRKVQRGDLFVALAGSHADGAAYLTDAVNAGALAVLVQRGTDTSTLPADLPVLHSDNPRKALALLAARFYPRQPGTIVAVTGTAGKTSVASFTAQIFKAMGLKGATIGTLGVVVDGQARYGGLTTPDPIALHQTLDKLARDGVTHVALEASSHGLDQHRLDGVHLSAGAFTNLGRDHMDYHTDEEDYFAAKARLMRDLMPAGAPFIVNLNVPFGNRAADVANQAGLSLMTIGGDLEVTDLNVISKDGKPVQTFNLRFFGQTQTVHLPLPGSFQIDNALTAAGLAIACKLDPLAVLAALERLSGVPGRLDPVDMGSTKGQIFVDYAHKPDALNSALDALRPYAKRLLICVVGAGGDRDKGKRPLMGKVAADKADLVIVTDDNPRTEDPQAIRNAILEAAPKAIEIADRAAAIQRAISIMGPDDVVLIAGKGHEPGQIVGDQVLPFSDHEEAEKALANLSTVKPTDTSLDAVDAGERAPLWAMDELESAIKGRIFGTYPKAVYGVSIDSRTTQKGDIFFAIKGDRFDGHDFVTKAFRAGAALAVVSEDKLPALGRAIGPLLVVDDVLGALRDLGRAARARSHARIVAVTGSVGKTSTKEMLALGLSACGLVHASVKSFNNHWGVPLTLARMPVDAEFGVFEIGMNHANEITPLTKMVRPHVAVITTIAPVHLEFFDDISGIAAAKAEIFDGLEPAGIGILNQDNEFYSYLKEQAERAFASDVWGFGDTKDAEGQLKTFKPDLGQSEINVRIGDDDIAFTLPTTAKYLAQNAISVLLAAKALGADVTDVAGALSRYELMDGRGATYTMRRQKDSFTLIDDSYNANPASMAASIGLMGSLPNAKRRIVVLGDMLELGEDGPDLHKALGDDFIKAGIDRAFLCGPVMKHLWETLHEPYQGAYADHSDALLGPLLREIQAGDAIMIKGSLGMQMAPLVHALKTIFHVKPAQDTSETS